MDPTTEPAPSPTPAPLGPLYAALAAAQSEIDGASKSRVNPAFRSNYADLASCWDACREALAKNGLAVVQLAEGDTAGGLVTITTILGHSSGAEIRSTLTMPMAKKDAHGVGSAITYGRRYGLCAMVGISPEDDDGNGAAGKGDTRTQASGKDSAEESGLRDRCNTLVRMIQEARTADGRPRPTIGEITHEAMGDAAWRPGGLEDYRELVSRLEELVPKTKSAAKPKSGAA